MTTPQIGTPATVGLSWRQGTLLLFFSGSDRALDPIRVMKGLFVFTMEAPEKWLPRDERYEFKAYSYGPYSSQVSNDLDYLSSKGFLQTTQAPGKSWSYYALSENGASIASSLAPSFDPNAVEYLRKLREFVASLSFRQLLDTVYAKYPEYAVNSVFKS